jgi:hypothetical protein
MTLLTSSLGFACCPPIFSSSRASCIPRLLSCYGGPLQVCCPSSLPSHITQIDSRSRSRKAANEEGEGNPAQQVFHLPFSCLPLIDPFLECSLSKHNSERVPSDRFSISTNYQTRYEDSYRTISPL